MYWITLIYKYIDTTVYTEVYIDVYKYTDTTVYTEVHWCINIQILQLILKSTLMCKYIDTTAYAEAYIDV